MRMVLCQTIAVDVERVHKINSAFHRRPEVVEEVFVAGSQVIVEDHLSEFAGPVGVLAMVSRIANAKLPSREGRLAVSKLKMSSIFKG